MFENAVNFNGKISDWKPLNTKSENSMFKDAKKFSQDLSSWVMKKLPDYYTTGFAQGAIQFTKKQWPAQLQKQEKTPRVCESEETSLQLSDNEACPNNNE